MNYSNKTVNDMIMILKYKTETILPKIIVNEKILSFCKEYYLEIFIFFLFVLSLMYISKWINQVRRDIKEQDELLYLLSRQYEINESLRKKIRDMREYKLIDKIKNIVNEEERSVKKIKKIEKLVCF